MRARALAALLAGITAPLAVLALGCPASLDDRCGAGACAGRDASSEASVTLPPGCTAGQGPREAPACVDDQVAVFVSENGDDGHAGTRADPVRTIAAAVSLASASGKPHIYVCPGQYSSSVDLRAATSIFGGLECDWKTRSAQRPRWTAASAGFALKIAGVAAPVTVADIDIAGADAQADGESSIGVLVAGATSVRLSRVDITAGGGKTGKSGLPRLADRAVDKPPKAGGDFAAGARGATNNCPDGASIGGTGGYGGLTGPAATAGVPPRDGGAPGASGSTSCGDPGVGKVGDPGADGKDAAVIATLGVLAASGWTPTAGQRGGGGILGQGGGGGGANTAAGGGGGAGGCGGAGGDGGGGGGGSVALAVYQSSVVLDTCTLRSGAAGGGGSGAPGQPGQPGGFGGSGGEASPSYSNGCAGGAGGGGGSGGAGAGGAAGVAPAILSRGAKVERVSTTLVRGAYGAPGSGGRPTVNDGLGATPDDELKLP